MKVRIVNLDFYMNAPIPNIDTVYSEFRGSSVNYVPVIRIYGSVETGQKICLHVHGVFPYIYIPYDGLTPADGFLYQIASSLDKALNLSLAHASSSVQHVYQISLVSGIPFYGFHSRQHQFLKIYFYNPLIIKKACTLLQNGSILGKIYQPYEAHIPYILQFMIDYNLHGMSFIHLTDLKYRSDPHTQNHCSADTVSSLPLLKISSCELEADTHANYILNHKEISDRKLTINPGIKALWDDEQQRKRNKNESSQIGHCLTQNRNNIIPTATHVAYKNILDEKLKKEIKNNESPQLNLSVYPAETPPSACLLNASTIESHSSISQSSDSSSLNVTITPDSNINDLNKSYFNEDAQKLYELLKDLREDNIDKDSILSRIEKDSESDEEVDLSLPLNVIQTPKKSDNFNTLNDNKFWDDSYFNALSHIPQLDGSYEGTSTKEKSKQNLENIEKSIEEKEIKNTIITHKDGMKDLNSKGIKLNLNSLHSESLTRKIKRKKCCEKNINNDDKFGIDQYHYLDGPNDSSSDNDDCIKPVSQNKCKRIKKCRSQPPRYSPLKVRYGSPTKNADLQNKINRPSISLSKQDLNEIPKRSHENNYHSTNQNSQYKYRRKLTFSEILLSHTQSSEKLVCSYKLSQGLSKAIENIRDLNTPERDVLHTFENEQTSFNDNAFIEQIKDPSVCPNDLVQNIIENNKNYNVVSSINDEDKSASNANFVSKTTEKKIDETDNVPISQFFTGTETISDDLFSSDYFCNASFSERFNDFDVKEVDYEDSTYLDYFKNVSQANISKSCMPLMQQSSNLENIKSLTELSSRSNEMKESPLSQIVLRQEQINKLNPDAIFFEEKILNDDKISTQLSESNKIEKSMMCKATPFYQKGFGIEIPELNITSKESIVNQISQERFDSGKLSISDLSKNSSKSYANQDLPRQELKVVEPLLSNLSANCFEDTSVSQITPFQKKSLNEHLLNLTTNLTICQDLDQNVLIRNKPSITIPKYNPPSRTLIESTLMKYNIPKIKYQEPFYSNVNDSSGNIEVGTKVLKIFSNHIMDLPEFETHFKGLTHYRKFSLEKLYPNEKITDKEINNYKLSFCKNFECIINTAKLPPTRKEVELWLKEKITNKKVTTKVLEKKKIFIPSSPGADDDFNDSLIISPCISPDKMIRNMDESKDDDAKNFKSMSKSETSETSPVIKKNNTLKKHKMKKARKCIDSLLNPNINPSERHNLSNFLVDNSNISTSNTLSKLSVPNERKNNSCQITGVTLDATNNFAVSYDNLQNVKAVSEYLYLTIMCMELIIETRNECRPNPDHDVIRGIVYTIFNDVPEIYSSKRSIVGCFLLNNVTNSSDVKFSVLDGISINGDIKIIETEKELLQQFSSFIIKCDPDILVGYEIEMLSWGYLIERGYILNLNLVSLLSRISTVMKGKNEDNPSDLAIQGRIILDFWRLLRHEIALQSYTFENIVYHILHERVPMYSFKNITYWWNHPSALYRNTVLNYYFYRVKSILKIMDQLDLIGRTSELAKLFGIQFFEVLSRGSQFRVESIMLRLAKPLNYISVSPSVQQRAKMRAPECLPLILEPESKFYADPVIVLDFQSLYPSIIIAYNYCFSTCLGRIEHLGQDIPFEFGVTYLKVSRKCIKSLHKKDLLYISPCGVVFVKKSVREGILPRMLQEILDTRLMVKKSLKENAGNKTLNKVLDARQLGLKLIANVTYGYTAANYSGRMPCVEVADSVVSKGRETLQRAINLVENTPKWGARVVYGDTDSMFVLVAGKSREDAFKIGAEIAEAVTNDNPSPVKLKLEKVFQPCILQTKKRYVGYVYESFEQDEPEYCAKGIETVRRDGCPASSKMLQKCLKILFDTRDISLIRQYMVRQFSKILFGRVSIQDLTFAKEYRGSSSYRPGACVPALELARKWMAVDKRSEPRKGERVPYVIINGPPGLPLIRLVRSPREIIADPSLRPNALYYITKVIIPPINRCFLLIGADANNWFNEMPRKQTQYLHTSSPLKGKKSTISQYFSTVNCTICGQQSKGGLCDKCIAKPQETSTILFEKIRIWEKKYMETTIICAFCCETSNKVACISLDCPVYYRRIQTEKDIQQSPFVKQLISMLPDLDF